MSWKAEARSKPQKVWSSMVVMVAIDLLPKYRYPEVGGLEDIVIGQ
jgi:hypothetical protein